MCCVDNLFVYHRVQWILAGINKVEVNLSPQGLSLYLFCWPEKETKTKPNKKGLFVLTFTPQRVRIDSKERRARGGVKRLLHPTAVTADVSAPSSHTAHFTRWPSTQTHTSERQLWCMMGTEVLVRDIVPEWQTGPKVKGDKDWRPSGRISLIM